MRFNELLSESRGLYARSPADPPFTALAGNQFGAQVGDQYRFVGITNYPQVGQFGDSENTRIQAMVAEKQLGKIHWVNVQGRNLAFGIAEFQSVVQPQRRVYFGKYFASIATSMFKRWGNDEVPGLQPELTGSRKARSGLKPQDILGAQAVFANGVDLMQHVQSAANLDPAIKAGLAMIGQRKWPVFQGQAANLAAIRDNLGEVIQALACSYGLVGGDADQARQKLLNRQSWNKLSIDFPQGRNASLVDFYLKSGGFSLGVSSKGGAGAKASAVNLMGGIQASRKAALGGGQDLTQVYPFAARVIETIDKYSQVDGPLMLGIETGSVTQVQAEVIKDMIRTRATKIPRGHTSWIKHKISQLNIKQKPGWNYGYWCLAVVARNVAWTINRDPNFSKGCLAFLNLSSVIQMYTDAEVVGNDVHITGIRSVYPPNFTGRLVLDAGKSYYSTDVKQKFTFGFE